jgi:hypothetical protein
LFLTFHREKGLQLTCWSLITIGVWHIKLMRRTLIICQNTLLGWLIKHLIVLTIVFYDVYLPIISLNIYKIKMLCLRVFWPTQACTIPHTLLKVEYHWSCVHLCFSIVIPFG